jgi:hypothetical protein
MAAVILPAVPGSILPLILPITPIPRKISPARTRTFGKGASTRCTRKSPFPAFSGCHLSGMTSISFCPFETEIGAVALASLGHHSNRTPGCPATFAGRAPLACRLRRAYDLSAS